MYLDHEWMREFGEALPIYRPPLHGLRSGSAGGAEGLTLRWLTPHNKWSVHSTYGDVETLLTQIRLQLPPDDSGGVAQRPAGESIDAEMRRLRIPAVDATSQLVGHEGHVLTVAFDASGELLASGGSDNTARLWDAV